jgi:hypothetical protein
MTLDRRSVLAAGLTLLGGASAHAQEPVFVFDGFTVLGAKDLPAPVMESLRAQIALVNRLDVSACTKSFFQGVLIRLDPALEKLGKAGPRGVTLKAVHMPPENPVLLHELMHVYHGRQLPDRFENAVVKDAYAAALASGDWPANSYMLSNVREFFAMTASTVLHGVSARPPRTRADVAQRMPAYFVWLNQTFAAPCATP